MKTEQIESLCSNLSFLTINTIRDKILKHDKPHESYTFGEALCFWLSDVLLGSKLVTADQLRILLEEFSVGILDFGSVLENAWYRAADYKRLPVCKIGFIDRYLVCMDGQEFFLDITTGKKVPTSDNWPFEMIVYNLTIMFMKYVDQLKKFSSAELKRGPKCTNK